MGSDVTNDKKKKGKIIDAISKWIPSLASIITLAVPVGNVILDLFNYDYARKAEEFYEIPSRYFVNSIIDDKFVILLYIVAYLIALGWPLIIRKLFKINRFDVFTSVICSLFITFLVIMTVFQSIIKIIGIFNLEAKDGLLYNITDTVIIAVIVVIAIMIFVLYMYLFMKDFSSARKENLEKQESTIIDEKRKKKKENKKKENKKSIAKEVIESNNQEKAGDTRGENKSTEDKKKESETIKNLVNVLFTIAFIIVFEVIFIAIGILIADRITENPKNKTKYELVTINDGDKGNKRDMAVVSYKNGKAVLMDCTIIPQATMNGKEIENLLLTKGKYRLIDIEGYQIEYREFNAVKCE